MIGLFINTLMTKAIDDLIKRRVRFEICNEGNLKTDERVFVSAARVQQSRGLKTAPAMCCLCLKRRNELGYSIFAYCYILLLHRESN